MRNRKRKKRKNTEPLAKTQSGKAQHFQWESKIEKKINKKTNKQKQKCCANTIDTNTRNREYRIEEGI